MCNEHRNRIPESAYFDEFSQLGVPLRWTDRRSNLEPKDSIRIRDDGPVIRWGGGDAAELLVLPWAWAGPGGKPVFNFRSDGRSFANSDRCLIPSDGFYEFTQPADPKAKRKDRWLITLDGEPWFWIAGLIRDGHWAMLTTQPGPDIAPFHDRQPVVLRRGQALDWLRLDRPETELLRTLPEGAFRVEKVFPSPLAGEGLPAMPDPAKPGKAHGGG